MNTDIRPGDRFERVGPTTGQLTRGCVVTVLEEILASPGLWRLAIDGTEAVAGRAGAAAGHVVNWSSNWRLTDPAYWCRLPSVAMRAQKSASAIDSTKTDSWANHLKSELDVFRRMEFDAEAKEDFRVKPLFTPPIAHQPSPTGLGGMACMLRRKR